MPQDITVTAPTTSWQEQLQPGAYCVIDNPPIGLSITDAVEMLEEDDLVIYGKVLNNAECGQSFLNIRAYSALRPDGEEGVICVHDITRVIVRDEFEAARSLGW